MGRSGGIDSLFIRYYQPIAKTQILEGTKKNIEHRGGADKLLIVEANDSTLVGRNLKELAELYQLSEEEAVFESIETGSIHVASFNMTQNDIYNFMKQPWIVTGSDGNSAHPRKYGSFPRKYHKYVKQEKVIDLGTFINGSSSKIAEFLRISNRGKFLEAIMLIL